MVEVEFNKVKPFQERVVSLVIPNLSANQGVQLC